MENKKKYTCSFTGHRPKGLPWGYKEKGKDFKKFQNELKNAIEATILKGYIYFISGMAMGVDLISAEMILKLKKKHPNIKLECALSCLNQSEKWDEKYKKRYIKVLKKADKITYVSNSIYYNGCMKKRNEYLIENSSFLIAIYNGDKKSGTYQTMNKAKDKVVLSIKI